MLACVKKPVILGLLALTVLAPLGCQTMTVRPQSPDVTGTPSSGSGVPPQHPGVPTEKDMSSLPDYVIEPPDVLLIEAVTLVPKPPYHIEALDLIQVQVVGTLVDQPISGQFFVDPSGMVDLGPAYGKVHVSKLTFDEANEAVLKHLRRILREPEVSVTLAQSSGQQQISGEHLVGPDGTVNLGTYGAVYVAGFTLEQAKTAIESHLSKTLEDPKISVDYFTLNSKFYYVITEGAGVGDNVTRVPITGKETVLDAIAQVNGLSRLASKKIWIARPSRGSAGCDTVLPVSYAEITKGAATATNYQVLPGDRVFIAESKLIALDNTIAKITAPLERIFGISLLGAQNVQTLNRFPKGFGPGF